VPTGKGGVRLTVGGAQVRMIPAVGADGADAGAHAPKAMPARRQALRRRLRISRERAQNRAAG